MSTTDKGVLVFNEWFEAMDGLDSREYKKLMTAMYRYQILGEEPPKFEGKTLIISKIIFKCLERRVVQARCGKKASEYRKNQSGINPIIDELMQKRYAQKCDEAKADLQGKL